MAKDVTRKLEDAQFSQQVTVERKYLPLLNQEEMSDTVFVTVGPQSDSWSTAARTAHEEDLEISVIVRKRVDPADLEELDGLVKLVEEIKETLFDENMGGATFIRLSSTVANPAKLEEHKIFQSLITATYRGTKTA